MLSGVNLKSELEQAFIPQNSKGLSTGKAIKDFRRSINADTLNIVVGQNKLDLKALARDVCSAPDRTHSNLDISKYYIPHDWQQSDYSLSEQDADSVIPALIELVFPRYANYILHAGHQDGYHNPLPSVLKPFFLDNEEHAVLLSEKGYETYHFSSDGNLYYVELDDIERLRPIDTSKFKDTYSDIKSDPNGYNADGDHQGHVIKKNGESFAKLIAISKIHINPETCEISHEIIKYSFYIMHPALMPNAKTDDFNEDTFVNYSDAESRKNIDKEIDQFIKDSIPGAKVGLLPKPSFLSRINQGLSNIGNWCKKHPVLAALAITGIAAIIVAAACIAWPAIGMAGVGGVAAIAGVKTLAIAGTAITHIHFGIAAGAAIISSFGIAAAIGGILTGIKNCFSNASHSEQSKHHESPFLLEESSSEEDSFNNNTGMHQTLGANRQDRDRNPAGLTEVIIDKASNDSGRFAPSSDSDEEYQRPAPGHQQ